MQSSNANAGGNYLQLGNQNVNIRSVGQVHTVDDIGSIVVAEKNGAPIAVRDIGKVREGIQPRLGQIGRDKQNDIVLGIVLRSRSPRWRRSRPRSPSSTAEACCRRACTSAPSMTAQC